jgi:hypothetical protein
VVKPFSVSHLAAVIAAVLGAVVLAGLTERMLGWGNLIVIGLLVPVAARTYLVRRTALMVAADGVLLDGQLVRWHNVGELVVIGPGSGGAIEIGVRRQQGSSQFFVLGSVPQSKFDPAALQTVFKWVAPRSAKLSGWGFEAPTASSGRAKGAAGVERSSGAKTEASTSVGGTGRRLGWDDLELRHRRWQGRTRLLRPLVTAAVILLVMGVFVSFLQLVRDEPETVPDDFVGSYPSRFFPDVDGAELVADSRLIGPHYGLALDRVAVVESLSAAADAPELPDASPLPDRLRASDGHELVIAYLGGPQVDDLAAVDYVDDDGDLLLYSASHESELDAWIDVDDDRRALGGMPEPWGVIVTSVPKRADTRFAVTDNGPMQAIDLRTGQRSEAIDGFYTPATQRLDHEYAETARVYKRTGALSVEIEATTIELSIRNVAREPWHRHLGYPEPGRAWLRTFWIPDLNPYLENLRPNGPTTLALVDSAGNEIPAHPDLADTVRRVNEVVFDVPDDFTTGTLLIRPAAGAELISDLYAWETPPPDASVDVHLSETPT